MRVEYAKACVNTTTRRLEPEGPGVPVGHRDPLGLTPYPWRDRFGDGKWMQQP